MLYWFFFSFTHIQLHSRNRIEEKKKRRCRKIDYSIFIRKYTKKMNKYQFDMNKMFSKRKKIDAQVNWTQWKEQRNKKKTTHWKMSLTILLDKEIGRPPKKWMKNSKFLELQWIELIKFQQHQMTYTHKKNGVQIAKCSILQYIWI